MAINLSWEALGVISAVGMGVLGWLFKLQADIVNLKTEVKHLRGENKDFKTFMTDVIDKTFYGNHGNNKSNDISNQ